MKLVVLQEQFDRIIQKGYNEGLTIQDYSRLKIMQKNIDTFLCAHQQSWCDLYEEMDSLLNKMYRSSLFHIVSEENISYIQKHAHLLPLVLANNKNAFKICGSNLYFCCPFHEEKTPSFRVNVLSNFGSCFGCGEKVNSFSYLENYEHLKFRNTILLLAKIYLFDIKIQNSKMEKLAFQYQEAIVSSVYASVLNDLQEKSEDKGIFAEMIETRERIKKGEYDSNFVYKEPERVLYLK